MRQALTRSGEKALNNSSETLAVAQSLIRRFGSERGFMEKANPAMQIAVARNTEKAFFADYPTLTAINQAFEWNTATKWLTVQLFDLSEYCGCKDKLTNRQLEQCADIIVSGYGWMKVSEVMLFLVRFKAARYGRFYGSVDPMVILSALGDFACERQEAYFRHEQEERRRKAEEDATHCVTWDEYRTMKGLPPSASSPLASIAGGQGT